MFRKLTFAFVAAAAVGAAAPAALAPTAASAAWHGGGGWHGGGWHGGWHGGWGGGWGGPRVIVGTPYGFYGGYDGCLVRRLVGTPVGPQFRWANVC